MSWTHGEFGMMAVVAGVDDDYIDLNDVADWRRASTTASTGNSTAFLRVVNASGVTCHFYAGETTREDDTDWAGPFGQSIPAVETLADGEPATTIGEVPFKRGNLPRVYFDGAGSGGTIAVGLIFILDEG